MRTLLTKHRASGLVVYQRNYLEVYTYDKWSSHELPPFREGERFMPSVCEMKDGRTSAPSYLTEADLVGLMDNNGIGWSHSLYSKAGTP